MTDRIDPTAIIDPTAHLGPGVTVGPRARVAAGAIVGDRCLIGERAVVGRGARIGESVRIHAFAQIGDHVTIEDGVLISAGATVGVGLPGTFAPPEPEKECRLGEFAAIGGGCSIARGVPIGRYAIVGMGSLVVRAVPDFHLAVGAPARSAGIVCRCGQTLAWMERIAAAPHGVLVCRDCGRQLEVRSGVVTVLLSPAEQVSERHVFDPILVPADRRVTGRFRACLNVAVLDDSSSPGFSPRRSPRRLPLVVWVTRV